MQATPQVCRPCAIWHLPSHVPLIVLWHICCLLVLAELKCFSAQVLSMWYCLFCLLSTLSTLEFSCCAHVSSSALSLNSSMFHLQKTWDTSSLTLYSVCHTELSSEKILHNYNVISWMIEEKISIVYSIQHSVCNI
jgi:hypothetical protein